MIDDGESMARADDYVLGRMNHGERERAERDLERDARFRDAVMRKAVRMQEHGFARAAAPAADTLWQEISKRIGAMPQMLGSNFATNETTRGSSDPVESKRLRPFPAARWRRPLIAACLMGALALGYVAGVMSGGPGGLWPF